MAGTSGRPHRNLSSSNFGRVKDAGTSVGSRMVDQELEEYINLRQARSVVDPCRLISEPTVLPRGYYRAVDGLEAFPQPHVFLNCGATLFLVRTAQWSR